jgi:hypothetical protein
MRENLSYYPVVSDPARTILTLTPSASYTIDDQADKRKTRFSTRFVRGRFKGVSLSIGELTERLFDTDNPYFAICAWMHDIDYLLRGTHVRSTLNTVRSGPVIHFVVPVALSSI